MMEGLQLPLVRFYLRFYGGSNNGFPAGVLAKDFGFGIVPQTIPSLGLKTKSGRGIAAGATTAENLVRCNRGLRDDPQQKGGY